MEAVCLAGSKQSVVELKTNGIKKLNYILFGKLTKGY